MVGAEAEFAWQQEATPSLRREAGANLSVFLLRMT